MAHLAVLGVKRKSLGTQRSWRSKRACTVCMYFKKGGCREWDMQEMSRPVAGENRMLLRYSVAEGAGGPIEGATERGKVPNDGGWAGAIARATGAIVLADHTARAMTQLAHNGPHFNLWALAAPL